MDPARDLVLDGGPCAIGVESTIVDCTATPPRVLRLGAISQEQIDAALAGEVGVGPAEDDALGRAPEPGGAPDPGGGSEASGGAQGGEVRAPGTLESHYAPVARVLLVDPGLAGAPDLAEGVEGVIGLVAAAGVVTPDGWTRLSAPTSAEEYARGLYAALRRADELGLAVVVAVLPDVAGGPLALAVRDRLARAAHGGRA